MPSRGPQARPVVVAGTITSLGFASGDRFAVGRWETSPLGPFTDVMWARPDGSRHLLAPHADAAAFITAIYRFEAVEVVPITVSGAPAGRRLELSAGPLSLAATARRGVALPFPLARPRWFTRWVEDPIARLLLGVRTAGRSPTGLAEWYQASACRWVEAARASIDGADLGPLTTVRPALGVGFSEPPSRPSIVTLRTIITDPLSGADRYAAPLRDAAPTTRLSDRARGRTPPGGG